MQRFAGWAIVGLLTAALTGPAFAVGPYDGVYAGDRTSDGGGPGCQAAGTVTFANLTIADNKLTYLHFQLATVVGTVAPDGSFSASGQNTYTTRQGAMVQSLTGKVAGNAIQAETHNKYCSYRLSLKKK